MTSYILRQPREAVEEPIEIEVSGLQQEDRPEDKETIPKIVVELGGRLQFENSKARLYRRAGVP